MERNFMVTVVIELKAQGGEGRQVAVKRRTELAGLAGSSFRGM
jgi:hypothetical protein